MSQAKNYIEISILGTERAWSTLAEFEDPIQSPRIVSNNLQGTSSDDTTPVINSTY